MSATDREKIWDLYISLGAGERHFNELESKYRMLASSWLLAMFAGLGFVFTRQGAEFIIDPYSIGSLMSFLTAIGITLIWNMDIRVYHRLLDGYFVQGLVLERDNEWLPLIRTKMVFSQYAEPDHAKPDGGVMRRIKMFYVGGVGVPLGIGSSLIGLSIGFSNHLAGILIFLTIFSVSILWLTYIWRQSTSPLLGTFIANHKEHCVARLQSQMDGKANTTNR